MSEKVRIFTVAEANALLPKLNVMLERQMSMLRDVDALAEEMTALGMDPQLLDADPGSTPEREALKGLSLIHISEPTRPY